MSGDNGDFGKSKETPPDFRPLTTEEERLLKEASAQAVLAQEQLRRVDAEIELYTLRLDVARKEKNEFLMRLAQETGKAAGVNKTIGVQSAEDVKILDGRVFVRVKQNNPSLSAPPGVASVVTTRPTVGKKE